ncbi:MAG: DUF1799 domain-containing protein [Sphingomonadales bacterium]|nr:DUF1799 domain-containing protein [Sphingomonadales bacterium]MDE2171325.1 DUF1799 domain-containing protein [Sphingomonadales bacterium]
MGAPAQIVAQLNAATGSQDFEIWPQNADILDAFLFVSTQWRATARADGSIYWHGLDYAGVAAGLNGANMKADRLIWNGLRIMEAAARNRLNGIMETD